MKTKITEQAIRHYTISDKDENYSIQMTIADNDSIRLKTYKGNREFIFDNSFTEETLDKWKAIGNLFIEAVKLARKTIKGGEKG